LIIEEYMHLVYMYTSLLTESIADKFIINETFSSDRKYVAYWTLYIGLLPARYVVNDPIELLNTEKLGFGSFHS
jgi:hypothetical protein